MCGINLLHLLVSHNHFLAPGIGIRINRTLSLSSISPGEISIIVAGGILLSLNRLSLNRVINASPTSAIAVSDMILSESPNQIKFLVYRLRIIIH